MTQRLYYDDSYTATFTAQVLERLTHEGRPAVVLDQTYFYPEGGGQPADLGRIDGVAVIDVQTRDEDKAVLHILDSEISGDTVEAALDWARRFDLMQHHTGQHMLTQAFVQIADAHTVAFHLGDESVTIDVNRTDIPADQVDAAEDLANQIVFANVPITARIIDPADADGVRMRKMPDTLTTGGLRVIEIGDFDRTACGGTHVARTGEIGMIKILKLEKRGEDTRIEFRCGWRALAEMRARSAMINQLASELTVGYWELDQAVDRLRADLKVNSQALKAARKQLLPYLEDELVASAQDVNGSRLISAAFEDEDPGDIRALASKLVSSEGTIVLFGIAGDKTQLIMARSADLDLDMNVHLKSAFESLGGGGGGGRPDFAQGGGVAASYDALQTALEAAASRIMESTAR